MTLVTKDPSDIMAWDTLGVVIAVREGDIAALDILERVGEVSQTYSPLYLHLGDIYVSVGDLDKAKKAYMRAIELSDDGLIVVPEIERKIRKLK
jgi:predicted RNA polymerase sigma factor